MECATRRMVFAPPRVLLRLPAPICTGTFISTSVEPRQYYLDNPPVRAKIVLRWMEVCALFPT
jgi:hypothetical protein